MTRDYDALAALDDKLDEVCASGLKYREHFSERELEIYTRGWLEAYAACREEYVNPSKGRK